VPSLAFRFEAIGSGRSAVYSADTEPSDAVARLAQGTDILFHEATGGHAGHSSPAQAGQIAHQAGAGRLVLLHYPPHVGEEWVEQARETFDGPVELGQDLQSFAL
jgi:ribonuclease Z